MKTGKIINRGVQLYKQNGKQFLLLGLLVVGAGAVSSQLTALGGEFGGQLLNLLFNFLLCPIILFGVYRYYLGLWRGQSADLKGVLHYCHSGESYGRVLWFNFCYGCWVLLFVLLLLFPFFLVMVLSIFAAPTQSHWSIIGAMVIYFVFLLWLSLRVFLSYYLYLFDEQLSAWETLKGSFDLMKGKVIKLLPLYIFQNIIVLFYGLPEMALQKQWLTLDGSVLLCCELLIFVGKVVIMPLVLVTSAGFASEVLQDKQFAKEAVEVVVE